MQRCFQAAELVVLLTVTIFVGVGGINFETSSSTPEPAGWGGDTTPSPERWDVDNTSSPASDEDVPIGDVSPTGGVSESPSTSSPEAIGEIGMFDPNPHPIVETWPDSIVAREGSYVELACTASDTADHLPHWPKHELVLDLMFEDDLSRDMNSVEHGWWTDWSKSTKSRPSRPKGRIDITETAEVFSFKSEVTKSDEGWYRCRACIYKDTKEQSCDISDARFHLMVLGKEGGYDEPLLRTDSNQDTTTSSPQVVVYNHAPRASCQVFGDPHVITFDGSIYNMPGSSCDYVLAMDSRRGQWFVYGRMRPCGKIHQGVCLESVTIYSGAGGVELQRGWLINHEGTKVETRNLHETEVIKVGEYEVSFKGTYLTVKLLLKEVKKSYIVEQDWLIVRWDGLTTAMVEVPLNYQTQGLCGDNDADSSNDFHVWQMPNTNSLLFAESMKVDRTWSCIAGTPPLTFQEMKNKCGGKKLQKAEKKCRTIFQTPDFGRCQYDTSTYLEACIYDMCKGMNLRNDLYPWMEISKIDNVLSPGCNAAEAYAMKCSQQSWQNEGRVMVAGIEMDDWERESSYCAMKFVKLENIPKLGCPQSWQLPSAYNV